MIATQSEILLIHICTQLFHNIACNLNCRSVGTTGGEKRVALVCHHPKLTTQRPVNAHDRSRLPPVFLHPKKYY
jgi:hypothetical protein